MRAIRALIVSSAGFDALPLVKIALNRVWREANHGTRQVDFTFRSRWNDADRVEQGSELAYNEVNAASVSNLDKHSWIGRIELLNMLELKGTRTREWVSIESPDIVVLLVNGKHDEWLDVYERWCSDNGARLIKVNQS